MDTASPLLVHEQDEDQYIQQLLSEAQARLQSSSAASEQASTVAEAGFQSSTIPQIPKLSAVATLKPVIQQHDEISTINTLSSIKEVPVKSITPGVQPAKKTAKDNAGTDWFNMPKTRVTSELKRDLQLIRMRNVLDPHRHYKKESGSAMPEYSQVGTIVEGPTEFFKSRIAKKDRKKTFVEEALTGEQQFGRFKAKYNQIQAAKTSGKKAYYNRLRAKRRR